MRIVWTAGVVLAGVLPAQAQETLAGVGAAGGIAAGMGAISATNITAGSATKKVPGVNGTGGFEERGGGGGGGSAARSGGAAPLIGNTPIVRFNSITGQTFVGELLHTGAATRPTAVHHLRGPRGQSANATRLAYSTPQSRSHTILGKYQLKPVGWRAYYVPADRFKLGNMWKYVSIEDDAGDYPVRYYYKPNSLAMLRLLSNTPRRGPLRANRVIGFHTWQDAMLAGYRPDPVSRPEPAPDVVHLAQLSSSPQLDRYVEYLYAGQVVPASHDYNMKYVRNIEKIVNSKPYSRPYMKETVRQVIGAILGENPLPTSVGSGLETTKLVSNTMPVGTSAATNGQGGTIGGSTTGPPSGADKREEDFNTFGNRAGKLANVPANNGR